jgi:LPXTG-motif cell wall-anchored protein
MQLYSIKSLSTATVALVITSLMFVQPAYAAPIDVAGSEMNFGADIDSLQELKIGDNAGLGFTYRYEDVLTGVDAIATVLEIDNLDEDDNQLNGADNLMDEFDDESSSGEKIDADIDIFGEPGNSGSGFVSFRIDFVAANTNNAVTLENIGIQVTDVDDYQYVQFAGISAYELSADPATALVVSATGGAYEFNEPIGFDSQPEDEQTWVAVEYAEASSITITLGARNAGSASFGVAFVDTTWTETPSRVTPALTAYDLTYDDNGASSGSVPAAQTSTVNSATVTLAAPQGNLIKSNCTFGGWNTREDGQGANFLDTESITMTADTTLYAKWTCANAPSTPAATTTPTLATTGANVEWLMVAGLIAVIAGAGFLTVSRRKRTQ